MKLNILLDFALLLFAGLIFAKIIRYFKLPDVTGYLIGGLLIGPSVLGLLNAEAVSALSLISEAALGFIAFSIGSEFKLSYFKRVGAAPIVIAVFESFLAAICVTIGLLMIGQELPFSLVLGAIAAATAPAATIMVIKQYKARGPVTETLLSVVAIDDATTLIAFGIAVAAAQTITSKENVSLALSILKPVAEIAAAVIVGGLLGLLFTALLHLFRTKSNRLILTIAVVLLTTAVANLLNVSALLMTMTMGAVFANLCRNSSEIMSMCDDFTPPVFTMFFVLSGAGLELSVLPSIGLVGIVYILTRLIGKVAGTWLSATIMKTDKNICRWLGPALLPQAGVAIGLSIVAQEVVPQYAQVIRAVVLCSTLIHELIGPGITKWSLQQAGEIEMGK